MAKRTKKVKASSSGLAFRFRKSGDRRLTADSRDDQVTETLNTCTTVEEMCKTASKFGVSNAELAYRTQAAPNPGQLRMVLGNRIRGVVNRIKAAKDRGVTITTEQAAGEWDENARKVRIRGAARPRSKASVTKVAKKVAKKVGKKTSKKVATATATEAAPPSE